MRDKNLKSLKIYYSELYESIINIKGKECCIKEVKSKNGMNNLLFNEKIYIHSTYNPKKEAENWIDNITLSNNEDTIIVIGLGLGYYLDNLVNAFRDKKIIIIEPNLNIFNKLLSFKDISQYIQNENIVFLVEIEPYIIRRLISDYLRENKMKKVYIAEVPVYNRMYKDYIQELYTEIDKGLFQLISNIATEICFSQMWLNNTIRLLDFINNLPNVALLKDEFINFPVVIVSAGPSLDKNIHLLKGIYNKAIIIAAGSAINILEKNNITPHIIMGFDGQEMEAKIFENIKNTKPLFIFGPSVHYKAVEGYKGLKMSLILKNDISLINFYENLGIKIDNVDSGPSVSNMALVFANYIKCGKVMLIGQDLCYTNNNRYADGGIHNHEITDREKKELSQFKKKIDIYGNEVYTKTDLIGIKNWFEEYLKVYKDEIQVYNCTEGGLNIDGAQNMKFQDAINNFCIKEVNVYEKLQQICKSYNNKYLEKIESKIIDYKNETKSLKQLSKKRLVKIYELINNYDKNTFDIKLKEILDLGKKIEKYESFKIFIEPTGKLYMDSITSGTNNKVNIISSIDEKKKIILNGMAGQYEYIHKCIIVVDLAFEKKDIKYTS